MCPRLPTKLTKYRTYYTGRCLTTGILRLGFGLGVHWYIWYILIGPLWSPTFGLSSHGPNHPFHKGIDHPRRHSYVRLGGPIIQSPTLNTNTSYTTYYIVQLMMHRVAS